MNPEEQLQAAKEGKPFLCIFFPSNLMRIYSKNDTHYFVKIFTVQEKIENTGAGPMLIKTFGSWNEAEKIHRLERGFRNGEYELATEKELHPFKTPCEL